MADQLDDLRLKYQFTDGIPKDFIDDMIQLIALNEEQHFKNEKIRYKYTDDEYGAAARELHKNIPLRRIYSGDAGIDLPIVLGPDEIKHGKKIWPHEYEDLHTGVIMEFPVGYFAQVVHRSSAAKKHRLVVVTGIIDDYRGEIFVRVYNPNSCALEVNHGERIGQMILAKVRPFQLKESSQLRPSERGNKGFGSSGK